MARGADDGLCSNLGALILCAVTYHLFSVYVAVLSAVLFQFRDVQQLVFDNTILSIPSTIGKPVKASPLQAMEAHGECGCKGPHIHSNGTRKM